MRRLLLPLVALSLVAAGCGSANGSGGSSGGSVPAGASVAPASSAVFVSATTDFGSDQWKQVVALFDKFPGGQQLLAQAEKQLKGVSLADIGETLGPETDLVLLGYENGGNDFTLMTQPKDEAKLQSLLAQSGQKPATTTIDGWTVIADTKLQLDAFEAASKNGVLADSDTFKQAMDKLPTDAAAKLYVAGDQVTKELRGSLSKGKLPGSITGTLGNTGKVGTLDSIAAAAVAEQNGLSLSGDVAGSLESQPETYSPKLPSQLPAGALVYVSFANLDAPLRQIYKSAESSQPKLDQELKLLEGVSGLSVEGDLLPILSQEGALAVYPSSSGAKLPNVALVLELSDPSKVSSLLDRLSTLAGTAGGTSVTTTTISGASMKKFQLQGVTVLVGVFDDMLVVTNAESVVTALKSSGDKLADDPLYKEAVDGANVPDKVLGLVYTNLHDGLPVAFGAAEQSGSTVPPEAKANTAPLQSALVWASSSDKDFPFGGFVGIK